MREINAVWTETISEQIPGEGKAALVHFLELLDFCDDHGISHFLDEDAIYENEEFCRWIYTHDDPGLNDIKRELCKRMSKYRHIGRQEQKELLDSIGETGNRLVIGMDFNEEKVYYACTVRKMYTICRLYLLSMGKNEFIDFMHFCYPDIYFDESVPASINTLNRNFPDLQSEIVNHLNALNDYKGTFLQLTGENKGYRYIAEKFQRDTGIECSPQAGRDKVSALKRTFINEINDVPMTVTCELHTKFKRFNTDRTKQDRIYFAPAKKEIKKGKVIVVHIGKHL